MLAAVPEIYCSRPPTRSAEGRELTLTPQMIAFAESRKMEAGLEHLSFRCIDAAHMKPRQYDIATSTLCLHELPGQKACELLNVMLDHSNEVLIADYTEARTLFGKLSVEFDEMISGHYRNYRAYRNMGEIPCYAEIVGAAVKQEIRSAIDGISIWRLSKS